MRLDAQRGRYRIRHVGHISRRQKHSRLFWLYNGIYEPSPRHRAGVATTMDRAFSPLPNASTELAIRRGNQATTMTFPPVDTFALFFADVFQSIAHGDYSGFGERMLVDAYAMDVSEVPLALRRMVSCSPHQRRPGLGRRPHRSHRLSRPHDEEDGQADRRLQPDLKSRGMLESTLIVWGGEFGHARFRRR